jgi:hypothetical protein
MTVVIIWDNAVFIKQDGGAWKRGDFTRIEDAADLLRDNLPGGGQVRMIYDPESLITEIEEAPKGSRKIVGLALADRHAAITSETQVWGFQSQWAVPGKVAFATFIHTEASPGFIFLRDRLERDLQVSIEGAWPLLTPGMQPKPERLRAVLTVVHDAQRGCAYVGGYQQNGERLSLKLRPLDPSRLWSELFEVLRSAGVSLGEERRVGARVQFYTTGTAEQLEQSCPYIKDFVQQNDLHIESLDHYAQLVRRLPVNHPSNLLKALPGDLRIDNMLKAFVALAAAVVLIVGAVYGLSIYKLDTKEKTLVREQDTLNAQKNHLSANKQEITNLKLLYGSDVGWVSPGRAEFLRALAGAIPVTATATELVVDESGGFRLSGLFWQTGEKDSVVNLVRPIEQALMVNLPSLVVASDRSLYETKTGRFSVSGLLNKD